MTIVSRTLGRTTIAAAVAFVSAGAFACDINSPTDISCGPANVNPANPLSLNNPSNPSSPLNINNPANPSSPLNPANQQNDPATDPGSPYFSRPVYADGIFSLFEQHPRIIYPAGPPQTCRQGLDCPAGVSGPLAGLFGQASVAQAPVATVPYPETPAPHRRRRHRRVQAGR